MEKGSMRLEANVSLSPDGKLPSYKVELKNINSFRFLEKAIKAEIVRQEKLLNAGQKVEQETRGYDEMKQKTYSQRSKADAHDYRYFPEADLPPMRFSDEEILKIKDELPELPKKKRKRFENQYGISKDFIEILVSEKSRADYFEEAAKLNNNYKIIADLMVNKKLDEKYPEPAGLIKKLIELTNVEFSSVKNVEQTIKEVLNEQKKAVIDYKNGKTNVLGFLIGMAQKKLQGKGKPKLVQETLVKELNKNER